MLLLFVDETSDSKFKEYLGLSVATVNHTKYPAVKAEFHQILRKSRWDESIEFKGSHLFSEKSGDTTVDIGQRIEIAEKLIDLNVAKSNARINFHYTQHNAPPKDHATEYLRLLPGLLQKALPKAPSGPGKNLIAISCDKRSDITPTQIRISIASVLEAKSYVLFEEPTMVTSNFQTVGILYADIVGYLTARIDTISNDVELFDGLTEKQIEGNGKLRKLRSSEKLLEKVKNLKKYQVKGL